MKIRTRLFVIFGSLFGAVFLTTFYVEEYFTKTSLTESKDYLKSEIVTDMKERRAQLIDYIGDQLRAPQGQVDALIERALKEGFLQGGDARLSLATLMLTNQWVDLAQYGQTTLIFGDKRFRPAQIKHIDTTLSLVWVDGERYIGIPIDEAHTALFSEESVRAFSAKPVVDEQIKLLEPYLDWVAIPDRKPFVERVIRDVQEAREKVDSLGGISQPPVAHTQVEKGEEETFTDRYALSGMAWGLANMLASQALDPVGMVYEGRAVLTKDIFFDQAVVTPTKGHSLEVLIPKSMSDVFLGNSGQGLTIALRGNSILREITQVMSGHSAFIADDRVVLAFAPDGTLTSDQIWHTLPVEQLIGEKTGMIQVGGDDYFFIHADPQGMANFHFFIFIPKEREFAVIDQLDQSANKLIHSVPKQVRYAFIGGFVLVLFILSSLSKRITKPITELAKLTKEVAGGRLEGIEMPKSAEGRKDEVYTLYHSFFDMIKGLQEKERVRGILNKVVSPEIAEETLKGKIKLGGEEKEVTVFFADIRNFTSLTEKMEPTAVITLINECMTKVSHVIDEFGGVIDKYVGDEVMALFGAPVQKPDSPLQAVQCAQSVLKALREWNGERAKQNLPAIEMGVGIHTGVVVAGNMGAENRLNYTVLGSGVNLAARLCSTAQPMEILISESTMAVPHVKEHIKAEEKTSVELKGFTQPVRCYSVS